MTKDPQPVALVTGGGTGIGAATAARLRGYGWQVAICGRRPTLLEHVARETGAVAITADVSNASDANRLVQQTIDQFGRLDGLVLNAGITRSGPVVGLSDEDWDGLINTNLTGPFRILRAALPHLVESSGSVVGVASMSALRATSGSAGYNVTKAGLVMLIQSVAVDHGPLGVRSNAVCPAWTRTDMADMEIGALAEDRGIDLEAAYRLVTSVVPARRPATASEVAAVVHWLLTPEASYVNGAVIPVDGGQSAVDVGGLAFDPRVTVVDRYDGQAR